MQSLMLTTQAVTFPSTSWGIKQCESVQQMIQLCLRSSFQLEFHVVDMRCPGTVNNIPMEVKPRVITLPYFFVTSCDSHA